MGSLSDTEGYGNIKFWVVLSMPFPVKRISTEIIQRISQLQFSFELLETGNSKAEPTW
jgi:hypothetical protein